MCWGARVLVAGRLLPAALGRDGQKLLVDFATAGGHFNINGQQHGVPGAVTAHAGELPNLEVGADGRGTLLFYSPHLSLNKAASNGLTFGNGTAVIVHANEDDYKTQPSGNSGGRIACGVVKLPA